jgi:hypothetical protein
VQVLRGSSSPVLPRPNAPQRLVPQSDLVPSVRPRFPMDAPVINSAAALGLGPPPPDSERSARRLGLGVVGTLATILWMWTLAPLPL